MNRRDFIRQASLLSAYLLAQKSLSAEPAAGARKIIVIGAGIAGLAAARTLKSSGFEVIVLEARGRTGGRIWTNRLWKKASLDLGASWLRGGDDNVLAPLVRNQSIDTRETNFESIALYGSDRLQMEDDAVRQLRVRFAALLAALEDGRKKGAGDAPLERVVSEYIGSPEIAPAHMDEMKSLVHAEIENRYAADLGDLSSRHWNSGAITHGPDVMFPGGFDWIIDMLARGIDVRLDQPVRSIASVEAGGISVQTDHERFDADRVIVTAPLGVLKSGDIAFTPALPAAHVEALHRLNMGVLNKCYLRFKEIFWDEARQWIVRISPHPGEWTQFFNIHPLIRKSVLLGLNSGRFASALENMSDEDIVAGAMDALRSMYGSSIPEPELALITRWGSDPFSRGSYAHIPPGASRRDIATLAKPVDNRLFFAGEHTSEYFGTVHGAYLSGLRAAQEAESIQ